PGRCRRRAASVTASIALPRRRSSPARRGRTWPRCSTRSASTPSRPLGCSRCPPIARQGFTDITDAFDYGVDVRENVSRRDSQDPVSIGPHCLVTCLVFRPSVFMAPPIHLDYQPDRRTVEVRDPPENRSLASEAVPGLFPVNALP